MQEKGRSVFYISFYKQIVILSRKLDSEAKRKILLNIKESVYDFLNIILILHRNASF